MHYDRQFLIWALGYAAAGMVLGIVMAGSQDHSQHVTHAHILLVGFVVSFIYAVTHRLWLGEPPQRLATAQFYLHQAGALTMFVGLFLQYGGLLPKAQIGPVLGLASITVLLAALLMLFLVLKTGRAGSAAGVRQEAGS